MRSVTQVAFQIDSSAVAELDAAAAAASASRAEVLRTAVREYLSRRREAAIDSRLAAGYQARPESADENAFADVSIDGLAAGDLDW